MPPSLLVVVPTLNSHALLLFIDGPSGPEHRRWLDQCCAASPTVLAEAMAALRVKFPWRLQVGPRHGAEGVEHVVARQRADPG